MSYDAEHTWSLIDLLFSFIHVGVKFNEMSITCAAFVGEGFGTKAGSEVVVSGRKPYFFSYDTTTGSVNKVPGTVGQLSSTLPFRR